MNRHSTALEQRLDALAHRIIARFPANRAATVLLEFSVFTAKPAWACIFGAAMLAVLLATRLWYPEGVVLARNDAVTLAAVLIQILMVVFRLESLRGSFGSSWCSRSSAPAWNCSRPVSDRGSTQGRDYSR